MYDWVTNTHSLLGGECPHKCSYCYVDNPIHGRAEKYKGPIRLLNWELTVDYGEGKTIFIENNNDMFAEEVPTEFIQRILHHCNVYPKSRYVFQTKNPKRMSYFLNLIPAGSYLGMTLETNRDMSSISKAPSAEERVDEFSKIGLSSKPFVRFVTIEPILDFDVDILADMIIDMRPNWINIGADSKGHGLAEPSSYKIMEFVSKMNNAKIDIKKKHNLERILK
jgi:DNA repair photolyase